MLSQSVSCQLIEKVGIIAQRIVLDDAFGSAGMTAANGLKPVHLCATNVFYFSPSPIRSSSDDWVFSDRTSETVGKDYDDLAAGPRSR